MKTLKRLAVIAIAGIVGVSAANAMGPGGYEGMQGYGKEHKMICKKMKERGDNIREIMMQLDLSDAQRVALRKVRGEMGQKMRLQRKEMRGRHRVGQFVTAKGFDKQKFIEKALAGSNAIVMLKAERMEKVFSVLTPAQRMKFVELYEAKK